MLTEREISLKWRELFRSLPITEGVYTKASELIEELPTTSPLRQRYASELSDLRRLAMPPKAATAKKRAKGKSAG